MRKINQDIEMLDTVLTDAAQRGVLHLTLDRADLDGRIIRCEGQDMVNFGSCSYLGLEVDPRVRQGALEAIRQYGVHFSSSRAYMSAPPYREFEQKLEELFGAFALSASSTTLAHVAALPVLVEEGDAVILDQQVHHSVQTAANLVRVKGVRVDLVLHNRMDLLEELIVKLAPKHRRIWYLADGVYSMYGDFLPTRAIADLLAKYEQFHLYVDDAHGLSWTGRNGRGYVLSQMALHERMVLASSLGKGFGVGGGVLVFHDPELKRKVKTCGGPMIFSGPIQPPLIGAAIASADIHLSDEISGMQARLRERMQFCNDLMETHGLPLVAASEAPIRFVGMGLPRVAYNMVNRLMREGFYTNSAMFPAVPMRRAGVRFTLTLHQSLEDIRRLVEAMAHHLPLALAEEGSSLESVHRAFKLAPPSTPAAVSREDLCSFSLRVPTQSPLRLETYTSIEAMDGAEWDRLLGASGSFDAAGLRFLEATFGHQPEPRDRWDFRYYVVRDDAGRPVLATFFTEALWKDDMIEPEAVSRRVEQERLLEPDFLTSRMLAMGSLLTEGNHLYLDRDGDWRGALKLLLAAVAEQQEKCGATGIALRDLPSDDAEMDAFLLDQGFAKTSMPDSLVLDVTWQTAEEYWATLSANSKRHQKRNVRPWDDAYEVEVLGHGGRRPAPEEFRRYFELYRNVKDRSLALNTFDLPETLFESMLDHPCWELVLLRLKPEYGGDPEGEPVGVLASFIGARHYAPMVIGLDYRYVLSHGLYRQFLRQMVLRAQALGAGRIYFGMDATFEKERFGARVRPGALYMQVTEHYQLELMAQLRADALRG